MRGVLLCVLLLRPPDRWFGADKLKHFVVSALVETLAYSGLQYAGAPHRAALAGSVAAGAALGVGRELHDRRTKGLFSRRDLAWDAAGLAAGAFFVSHAER